MKKKREKGNKRFSGRDSSTQPVSYFLYSKYNIKLLMNKVNDLLKTVNETKKCILMITKELKKL